MASRAGRWLLAGVFAVACHHHTTRDPYASNFGGIRLDQGRMLDARTGEPYSGTVIARDAEIAQVATAVFGSTPLEEISRVDTSGLILIMPVVDGHPSGAAKVRADLHSARISEELVARTGQLPAAIAKAVNPTPEIAHATFVAGELEGAAEVFVPNADGSTTKIGEVTFRDNLLDGVAREYFVESGQPKRELVFDDGVPSGVERTYYASGAIEREAPYVEGRRHGRSVEHYEDGTIRSAAHFDRGTPVGTREFWYPNGQLERRVEPTDTGLRVVQWYSNGDVKTRVEPDGELVEFPPQGEIVHYHRNGKVHTRAHYVGGVEHGTFEAFYANGHRWETAEYRDGRRHGAHKKWWKNGQPALDSLWVNGELDGEFRRWYASGQPWEQVVYATGKRIGPYRKWWKNGTLAHEYAYVDGKIDGDYRTYYDGGAKWAVGQYDHGKPQGIHRRWFPDGRLGLIQHHENGRPHGVYRRWWADGSLRLDATYQLGKLHGPFKNWLEDGSIYEFATYEGGKKVDSTLEPEAEQSETASAVVAAHP